MINIINFINKYEMSTPIIFSIVFIIGYYHILKNSYHPDSYNIHYSYSYSYEI